MKRALILLLLCIVWSTVVGAQPESSGPPDQMWLCTGAAPDTCVLLQIDRDTYVDLGGYGTSPAFRYHLDAWETGFVALTGTSYQTDFDGKRQVSVVVCIRVAGEIGLLHGVRHLILGGKDTIQDITLKWDKLMQGKEAAAKLGNPVVPDHF